MRIVGVAVCLVYWFHIVQNQLNFNSATPVSAVFTFRPTTFPFKSHSPIREKHKYSPNAIFFTSSPRILHYTPVQRKFRRGGAVWPSRFRSMMHHYIREYATRPRTISCARPARCTTRARLTFALQFNIYVLVYTFTVRFFATSTAAQWQSATPHNAAMGWCCGCARK